MDYDNQRAEPRKRVSIPAIISDRGRSQQVDAQICDASSSGCRITSCDIEALPQDVLIKIDSLGKPIKGTIVWRTDSEAGVKFFFDAQKPSDPALSAGGEMVGGSADMSDAGFPGFVYDRKGLISIRCLIKNPNGAGCLLVTDIASHLPDEIAIKFAEMKDPLAANIVWRSGPLAGVTFDFSPDRARIYV